MLITVMENDDKIQLVHDSASNIWKVVREKTESERFWTGIRISCICISLVSIFGIGNKSDNEYQTFFNSKLLCKYTYNYYFSF